MFITDNLGKQIEVIDLDAAIKQVAVFMDYAHQDPEFKTFDIGLKEYWKDIQQKLLGVKLATKHCLQLRVNCKPNKEKWMADFLATKEEATDEEEINDFMVKYASSGEIDFLPDTLYVYEGSYFITMYGSTFKTYYNDSPRQFDSLVEAEQYLGEMEWQDSNGELLITLDPSCTLIEAVRTDYTGGNIYNDVVTLKDGTTIRISEGVITASKDVSETIQAGQIFY